MEQNTPRKVALVASCLLNQNAKCSEGANYPGVVSPIVKQRARVCAAAAALPRDRLRRRRALVGCV